jgi:leucyl-tRNA synthetase
MVLKDGAKMSKSKGNTVDPDMIINKYGADTIRFFILFAAPPEQNLEWSDSAIEGSYKFLKRFWKLSYLIKTSPKNEDTSNDNNILIKINNTISKVKKDIFKRKSYNTAIAAIMELFNFISKNFEAKTMSSHTATKSIETIAKLLYPITPHICYTVLSEFNEDQPLNPVWPKTFDTVDEIQEVQIIIQINGKLRSRIDINAKLSKDEVIKLAKDDCKAQEYIKDKEIVKLIYIPNKLINFVIKCK